MTIKLAVKGIATETKALVLLNEYEGKRMPMTKLRQVLQELSNGPEETAKIVEMLENHLRAEGIDAVALQSFLSEINAPVAVVDELGKTTRRLRSPFAMGFESTGAVNITGQQGIPGGANMTPIPNLSAPQVPTATAVPPDLPMPPQVPSPPMGGARRLTPAGGMASGYGNARPTPPPQQVPQGGLQMPMSIPSPAQGTNIPYPPPIAGMPSPNVPNPPGNLPMPGIPSPYPQQGGPMPMPAPNTPRPGLGARPSGTISMPRPVTMPPNMPPHPTGNTTVGRITPVPMDQVGMPKPTAHQAPLPGGGPPAPRGNTMHFGKGPAPKMTTPVDGRPVILVADDDKRIRMVHKIRLEEAGYNVVEASDGSEAWRRLQIGDVTLAILDMKMPGLHGLEVLSRLIDSGRKIPVVICSAYDQLKDEFIVATYPWLRYLVKPVTPEALMTAVKDLLAQVSKSA
ncbi:MAG TPA: response regulator [Planctomycetota bacterium]|nr:response regulator [Planctomycetota bacterium]